jgi:hypothetical protein
VGQQPHYRNHYQRCGPVCKIIIRKNKATTSTLVVCRNQSTDLRKKEDASRRIEDAAPHTTNHHNQTNTNNKEKLVEFRRTRAKARYLSKKTKKETWRNYVDTKTKDTPPTAVWNEIGKISGKQTNKTRTAIRKPDSSITTDIVRITNEKGLHFQAVCSSKNYDPEFLAVRELEEQQKIDFNQDDSEPYNFMFTLDELKVVLLTCSSISPGPDTVHSPPIAKNVLLQMYNRVWSSNDLPTN